MELLYINFINRDVHFFDEPYYFTMNYIIGEKVHIHSNVGLCLYVNKNIDKLKNDEIVYYLENYCLQTALPEKNDISKMFVPFDYAKKQFKSLNSIKSVKKISNQYLKVVHAHTKMANGLKSELQESCENELKFLDLYNLVDLYDEDIITVSFSSYTRDFKIHDENIVEMLFKYIRSRDSIIVLGDIFHVTNNLERFNEVFELQINEMGDVFSIRLPLLTIPCSLNTTSKDIILFRSQFHIKFNLIISKIEIFRKEIRKYKLNKDIKQKVVEFAIKIQDEIDILQDEINDNIYLKKIKNSDPDYINTKLEIVLLPLEFVLTFYAYDYALSIKRTIELRNKIYEEVGDNMCEVYLFYNVEQKNNQ